MEEGIDDEIAVLSIESQDICEGTEGSQILTVGGDNTFCTAGCTRSKQNIRYIAGGDRFALCGAKGLYLIPCGSPSLDPFADAIAAASPGRLDGDDVL